MSQPYVGEIRQFAGNFAPNGWLFCSGQLVSISDYDVLFNLIGTTYGGDGVNTFALPNLQGRVPLHMGSALGSTFPLGSIQGTETVTLTSSQLPVHAHPLGVAATATTNTPGGNTLAAPSAGELFLEDTPATGMNPASITVQGGSQPHTNMAPYLCVSFIISMYGIYPSPS